jgi:hypothetical protein
VELVPFELSQNLDCTSVLVLILQSFCLEASPWPSPMWVCSQSLLTRTPLCQMRGLLCPRITWSWLMTSAVALILVLRHWGSGFQHVFWETQFNPECLIFLVRFTWRQRACLVVFDFRFASRTLTRKCACKDTAHSEQKP